jgi:hypothetical protein
VECVNFSNVSVVKAAKAEPQELMSIQVNATSSANPEDFDDKGEETGVLQGVDPILPNHPLLVRIARKTARCKYVVVDHILWVWVWL